MPLYFNFEDRNLEARSRAIREAGEVKAVALAIHDVTELQRLSRARRDFVTNISHELRTPLASIQLLVETLLNGALSDQTLAHKLMTQIGTQVDGLRQLAQELLDLSLIESGQTLLKMDTYSLQEIVLNQVEALRPQAARKNLTVEIDIDESVVVLVDRDKIGHVITNLIHNAIKFTDEGSITLSTLEPADMDALNEKEWRDGWLVLSVADQGCGIAPDDITRIFERFYKVDQARSNRKETGTGLGLAIAKHIVEGHGGHIWAESSGSTGTTFYLTLPVDL
ncbi:MAG: ATP-binding protein, partial [Chloroflexota bacterium]